MNETVHSAGQYTIFVEKILWVYNEVDSDDKLSDGELRLSIERMELVYEKEIVK